MTTTAPKPLETDADGKPKLRPGDNRWEKDRVEGLINLAELTERHVEVAGQGERWQLVRGDEVIADESTQTPYRYMLLAWETLSAGQSAQWKTVAMLRTFRQAIRENNAQMMGFEVPRDGAGKAVVLEFIRNARVLDTAHHGQRTF